MAVVLVVVLAVTLVSVVLARTKKHLATTEQRLAETTAALGSASAALQRQRRQLNEMIRYEQSHRARQLHLAETGAHGAVEMAAKIYASGMAAFEAAIGGSLCLRWRRLPNDSRRSWRGR